jgi:small subunit ribosomal protein S6
VSRDYELAYILNPEVSEEENRSFLDRIEQIVATYGGQIVKVNHWCRRRLAYPIERHSDGYYVFIDMILTTESVAELERSLKVSEIVLRHMMKRRDPKAVQKEREERAEREARAAAAAAAAEAEAANAPAEAISTQDVPSGEAAALTPEEDAYVPAAVEESETIEA